jgi:class 3 adenylate cyclase
VLDAFYDECAEAIWDRDGLLNKTMGEAVMAIFNFPIRHEDHPKQAVLAAQDIQRRWTQRLRSLGSEQGSSGEDVGVGIGIDCGDVSFGVRADASRPHSHRHCRQSRLARAIGCFLRRNLSDGGGSPPRAGRP